jgi:Arc/MetJ family transcription regulator
MHDVRTTIDLPDDLHQQALSIARDTSRTLSETVADLMRRALGGSGAATDVTRSERTGLPVVRIGTIITTEDVRALEDE